MEYKNQLQQKFNELWVIYKENWDKINHYSSCFQTSESIYKCNGNTSFSLMKSLQKYSVKDINFYEKLIEKIEETIQGQLLIINDITGQLK